MAKQLKVKIQNAEVNSTAAALDFTPLVVQHQLRDRFYVPKETLLLIVGTAIAATTREGDKWVEQKNEKGEVITRTVGQKFPVVRLDDAGQPIEATELFVGQIVKVDAKRRVVFPGELSNALRKGSADFKKAICGKILEITEEGTCTDRAFDRDKQQYVRNEDGTFATVENKRVLKFEAKASALSAKQVETAEDMLIEFINKEYADLVEA
jgi:hypothetical protein